MSFSNQERTIILAFYYLDKPDRVNWFSQQFNSFLGRDVSLQTIQYEIAKLKNGDPANNKRNSGIDLQYEEIWKEYIEKDNVRELKSIYSSFKKTDFERFEKAFVNTDYLVFSSNVDEPHKKPIEIEVYHNEFERNVEIARAALRLAHYSCELGCGHELFMRRDLECAYVEGHHLIPLSFQDRFEYSLDVGANIISLCPSCHRLLHYGAEARIQIEKLYYNRIERLQKCGLYVSLEELLDMYNL